jgi:hypothetical protein
LAESIACSLDIISQISQPASNAFLSQKTSQQYFQPGRSKTPDAFAIPWAQSWNSLP